MKNKGVIENGRDDGKEWAKAARHIRPSSTEIRHLPNAPLALHLLDKDS